MKVRYLNVQNWTDDKNSALITHLTQDNPEVILFTSTSRTSNQVPIKIPFYNTFTTNKADERNADSGIAIRMGTRFDLLNNFQYDTIGATI